MRPWIVGFAVGLALFLASGYAAYVNYTLGSNRYDKMIREDLLRIAGVCSATINVDLHSTFVDRSQESTSEYQQAIEPMAQVLSRSKTLKFIYTCVARNGKVYFVLDPTHEGDTDLDGVDDKSHIMDEYSEATPTLKHALFSGQPTIETEFVTDRWGTFLSAYYPLRDHNGLLVGIVGVDIDASTYKSMFAELDQSIKKYLLWSAAISMIMGFLIARLQRQLRTNLLDLIANENGLRRLNRELDAASKTDALTGLPNRRALRDAIQHALMRQSGDTPELAVLFIDLDNFKYINDSMGHEAGDQLLLRVTSRISERLRYTDIVARLGGDEFAVLLQDIHGEDHVLSVARSILEAIQMPTEIENTVIISTGSIGIAIPSNRKETVDELLRHADAAMYAAKAGGKAECVIFEPSIKDAINKRFTIETDLRLAVENSEFYLDYQPIVDLHSGQLRGAEALVRWQHPEKGRIPPMDFIPVAEELGLIAAVGHFALRQACIDLRSWKEQLERPKDLYIAVNVSTKQLQERDFVNSVLSTIREFDHNPRDFVLEITETSMMTDLDLFVERLQKLREAGVRIAMDDFGTGYSSLAVLVRLPVDIVKIDKQFLRDAATRPHTADLIRVMISICNTLGFRVVAEGIETDDAWTMLKDLGCQLGQGYLFAKPLSAPIFWRYLEDANDIEAA